VEGQKQMICFFVESYLVANKFNKILLENTTCKYSIVSIIIEMI